MRRKENFILKNIGNENILIPTGNEVVNLNGIIVLNKTAHFLWEKLSEEITKEELAEELSANYEIDKETAIDHVEMFIKELSSKKMLVV